MANLVLGPLLRYVSETEATVWVETDAPCEVEILGRTEPTFRVEERNYALVRIEGLEPAGFYEYEVALDGERRWPEPGSELPPSAIRTMGRDASLDICFGSCRVALPHVEPYIRSKDEHEDGREFDALRVLATEMIRGEHTEWPELLYLLGDQVYVDEGSPRARERIRERRGTATPPGEEVTDYEEYAWLYEESWSEPLIRWLFSTVSTSMLWDDHDISDDWNISHSWLREIREKSWWHRRATAGAMSYWVYQHLGNLSPRHLDENELYRRSPRQPGRDRAAARVRRARPPGRLRDPLELLPRRRRHPHDLPRLAGRPGARGGPAGDGRRRGVGVGRRARQRRLRPSADRDHGPLPALARLRPPRGLERAGRRRRLGPAGGAAGREAAARGSTSTTGPPSASPSRGCAT